MRNWEGGGSRGNPGFTRARTASLVVAVFLWLAAAALLWRTSVPNDLRVAHLDAGRVFSPELLRRTARFDGFLRWTWVGATLAQLAALVAVVRLAPRLRVRGGARLRAAQYAAAAVLAAWLAALPFSLADEWWERRHGIAVDSYGAWLAGRLSPLATQLVVGAIAAAAVVSLARRLGGRWWLAGAPLLAVLGVLVVVVLPLAGGGHALRDPRLRATAQELERADGLGHVRIEVERASRRTRSANAEAVGVWPTARIVIWDTLRRPPFTHAQVRFTLAHELAHIERRHVWKGLAWFALLAIPGTWILAAVTGRRGSLRDPALVPLAALVLAVLQLAALPLTNAISRRYEAEADWRALETTRDPAAARALYVNFARTGLLQPNPPGWSYVFLDDHPTLLQRVEQAHAWSIVR